MKVFKNKKEKKEFYKKVDLLKDDYKKADLIREKIREAKFDVIDLKGGGYKIIKK